MPPLSQTQALAKTLDEMHLMGMLQHGMMLALMLASMIAVTVKSCYAMLDAMTGALSAWIVTRGTSVATTIVNVVSRSSIAARKSALSDVGFQY